MQDLRPVPLAAVSAAALAQVAVGILPGLVGDLGRLGMAGVVLPQPGVGGQVVLELRPHDQRHALTIDGDRRRAGRGDADAHHALGPEASLFLGRPNRPAHRPAEAIDIVGRRSAGQGSGSLDPVTRRPRRWSSCTPTVATSVPSATSTINARTLLVPKSTPIAKRSDCLDMG